MERFSEWMLWIGWRRVMFGVAVTPLVVLVAWWLLRLPPPPIESMIPVAPTVVSDRSNGGTADDTSGDDASSWLSPLATLAPSRVAVHVVGAVMRPGVYHMVEGARADDALRAAGGPSRDADLRRVNLAAPLHDGLQLVIPRVGERITATSIASGGSSGGTAGSPSDGARAPLSTVPLLVDINTATTDDLERLPGVGPATANAIIAYRQRNGPFSAIDQLLAVRGIGPAKLAEIRPWVRV